MSSAWLLPEHIADVLPAQARRIEELRRSLLDRSRSYGFELVMPPLLEHRLVWVQVSNGGFGNMAIVANLMALMVMLISMFFMALVTSLSVFAFLVPC